MNTALAYLLAAISVLGSLGCHSDQEPSIGSHALHGGTTAQVVYPIVERSQYGLMSAAGEELAATKFQYVSGGFTDTRIESLDWLVGQQGALLVDGPNWFFHDGNRLRKIEALVDDYRFSANLGDSLFAIYTRTDRKRVDRLGAVPSVVLDPTGRWHTSDDILPRRPISEGLIVISDGKRTGYADRKGNVLIPLRFDQGEAFHDGLAAVQFGGLWGFIDKSGELVIPPSFESVSWFDRGTALAKDPESANTILIDRKGDPVASDLSAIQLREGYQAGFCEGLLFTGDRDETAAESNSTSDLFHYIDAQGRRVSSEPFLESGPASRFSKKAAIVKRRAEGDSEETVMVRRDDLSWQSIPSASWTPFKFGLSADRSGRLGYIDETGKRRGPAR